MKKIRSISSVLSIIVVSFQLLSGSVRPALAQSDVCEEDRAKYCGTYGPDNPARLYCLKRNETQIKPSCKATLRTVPGTEAEFYDKCTDDYDKFCADVKPGKGRILKCLKANSKDLEFECRKMVSSFPNPK